MANIWQKQALIQSLLDHGFSEKIVSAFNRVRREDFVPAENKAFAYYNIPLPLGFGQTISQPYTIAFMLDLLEVGPRQKIMEVGSGSGYVLALLSELAGGAEVYGVERLRQLLVRSRAVLKEYKNIKIFQAGQTLGLSELALFDRILVSAAAEEIPAELLSQLAESGILVCPVQHDIVKIKREKGGFLKTAYSGFSFVPLIQ